MNSPTKLSLIMSKNKGRRICDFLKEIRKQIACHNGIPFESEECNYLGECEGSCPKCEFELKFSESKLASLSENGVPLCLENICSSMFDDFLFSNCNATSQSKECDSFDFDLNISNI